MLRRLGLTLVAVVAVLALSCGGGDDLPQPSPTATPTPAVTASPTATTTATPATAPTTTPVATTSATPDPTAAATPTGTPTPVATMTATPEPTPPAVTVTGPLLLISERLGVGDGAGDREVETWRLFVYDVALDKYWSPFDYRSPDDDDNISDVALPPVQPTGTSLIVWSDGQIRRVALNGEVEAVLFEDSAIRGMNVSPDGTKVAVLYGLPGTLGLFDTATGDQLLGVIGDDPRLASLPGRDMRLYLGYWNVDGSAVSVASQWGRTAIVALNGDIRVLPREWTVSSDLRYALQFREGVKLGQHTFGWKSIDVFDVATGNVAATISSEGGMEVPYGRFYWVHGEEHAAFGSPTTRSHWELPRALDTETGETRPLSRAEQWWVDGPAQTDCYPRDYYGDCDVRYDRRVVWEGADGWTRFLGLVELATPLPLNGVTLSEVVAEPALAPPPSREEMVGPLLTYEIKGEYRYVPDSGGGLRASATRRVVVYDEGTDRSWFVYDNTQGSRTQVARGGLLRLNDASTSPPFRLHYVSPDGQSALLDDRWVSSRHFSVSPDGRKVAIRFYGGGLGPDGRYNPARTVVLDIPSGDEILSVVHDDIPTVLGLSLSHEAHYWDVQFRDWGALAWTSDSAGVRLWLVDGDGLDGVAYDILVALDGDVRLVPCDEGAVRGSPCFSPDNRYLVRGYADQGTEYGARNWRHIDIIDFDSGQVLWSLESANFLQEAHWEWASPDRFAWSSGASLFRFELQPPGWDAEHAEVSVIDVTTGEIEVIDGADYLARFHPPPRATTDCPENPGHVCRILLDGVAVGEGRWPTIIGFVEFDDAP